MARSRGYAPFEVSEAGDTLLARIRERGSGVGNVAVFDLDGCLFDTRPRQVRILRELAEADRFAPLWAVREEHFLDWSLGATLRRAGVSDAWLAEHGKRVRSWWEARFFTSEYVVHDHAMPGAVALVRDLWASGAQVVYLTGRDVGMRAGTETSLRAWGFPYDAERTLLLVKPSADQDDTAFKDSAIEHIEGYGRVVLYLDNEPANVNMYRRRHPDALVVFVETDHSPRPDEPDAEIPWMRSFLPSR